MRRLSERGMLLAVAFSATAAVLAIQWGVILRTRREVAAMAADVGELKARQANAERPHPVSPLLLSYQLDLPGRGEIFPAMTTSAPDYWPVAVLRITNAAEWASAQLVWAELPGWSRRLETSVIIGPGETRQIPIRPSLLPRAGDNGELQQAVLEVQAESPDHDILFAADRPVLIHGGSEIYWGSRFANAQMAARWVTPHDPSVCELVAQARRFVPRGRMAGYESPRTDSVSVARQVRAQASAIFRALAQSGISYVNSFYTMGQFVDSAERIRLPRETLHLKSANCIDVSVTLASALENLGLEPIVVIVPSHAFAGVRLTPGGQDILYLDLTVLPDGSFGSATARARRWLRKTPRGDQLVVDVAAARVLGIYPLDGS